jgi:hypothetical protein
MEVIPTRPYTKDYVALFDCTIELNRSLVVIQRSGYTVLDLLSDIGGVQSIMVSTFAILVGILNYQHFDTTLASQLFKLRKPNSNNSISAAEFFKPTKCGNVKELCQDTFGCCRKNPRARMLDKARQTLEQEVNIVDMVRSMRYFKMSLRHLISQKKRDELEENSRYIYI